MYELFQHFLLVFCEHFRMGTHFVLKNVYQIQNFRYFLPVPHVRHAIRLTSAKANTLQQTQQPVLMPVLDLIIFLIESWLLPILTTGFMETTNPKLLFKNYSCLTLKTIHLLNLVYHVIRYLVFSAAVLQ